MNAPSPNTRPPHTRSRRTSVHAISILTLVCGWTGCGGDAGAPVQPTVATPADPAAPSDTTEPGVVHLKTATATKDAEQIVRFQVDYEFTSGAPVKTYLCTVNFPDTEHTGLKPLEAFELQPQGSFTMGIEVGETDVDAFEITFSEADSPDRGYTVISNTLTGQLSTSAE